jgi:hypothetical protein
MKKKKKQFEEAIKNIKLWKEARKWQYTN